MTNAKAILNPTDYSNYRNIRAAGVLYVFLSVFLVLGGIAQLLITPEPGEPEAIHPAFALSLIAVGVAGVMAGVAIRRGNRRMRPLIYFIGFLYLLYFPIGTIVSVVVLRGLPRHLDSSDVVKNSVPPAS